MSFNISWFFYCEKLTHDSNKPMLLTFNCLDHPYHTITLGHTHTHTHTLYPPPISYNNTWPLKRGFDRASHMIYWMLAMWQNDHLYHKDNYILEQFISTSNIWKFKFQVILFLKWRNLLANLFEVERETNSVFKTNETDQIDLIIGIDMLKYNEFYSFIFRPI